MLIGAFSILKRGYTSLVTSNPPPKSYVPEFALPLPFAYCELSANLQSMSIFFLWVIASCK